MMHKVTVHALAACDESILLSFDTDGAIRWSRADDCDSLWWPIDFGDHSGLVVWEGVEITTRAEYEVATGRDDWEWDGGSYFHGAFRPMTAAEASLLGLLAPPSAPSGAGGGA